MGKIGNIKNLRRLAALPLALFMLGLTLGACGSDDTEVAAMVPRVSDSGTILALEDLTDAGFKKSKTYDVEGMTGAVSAYYGFWGPDPYDRKDFEVRFFASHSDAVELGTALADERSGDDALLEEDNSNWPVALKDARRCTGSKAYSGPQNCLTPKYLDFSIYANMIVLCSGEELETAQMLCSDFLVSLGAELQPA